jgi:hypothetical protein
MISFGFRAVRGLRPRCSLRRSSATPRCALRARSRTTRNPRIARRLWLRAHAGEGALGSDRWVGTAAAGHDRHAGAAIFEIEMLEALPDITPRFPRSPSLPIVAGSAGDVVGIKGQLRTPSALAYSVVPKLMHVTTSHAVGCDDVVVKLPVVAVSDAVTESAQRAGCHQLVLVCFGQRRNVLAS